MNVYFEAIPNQSVMLSVDMPSLIAIELRAIARRKPEYLRVKDNLSDSGVLSLLCSKDILAEAYSSSTSSVFKRGMLKLSKELDILDSSRGTVYTELCIKDNQVSVLYGEAGQSTLPLIVFEPLLAFIINTVLDSVVQSQLSIAV